MVARALAPAVAQVEVRNFLLNLTRDKSKTIRGIAVYSLYSLEDATLYPDVQARLMEIIIENSDEEFTDDIIRLLTKPSTDLTVLERLLKLSRDREAQCEQQLEPLKETGQGTGFWRLSDRINEEQKHQRKLENAISAAKKGLRPQPAKFRDTESSRDDEEIVFQNIDEAELSRLVKAARHKDPKVRVEAVKTLSAHRNQPEVLTALLGLTRGMAGWDPAGRLFNGVFNAVPRPVWWSFFIYIWADLLLSRFAPQFAQNWYQPAKSIVTGKWSEGVQWLQSLALVRWLGRLARPLDQLFASNWMQWLVVSLWVFLILVFPLVIGRIMRGGRSKRAMLDVAQKALSALQSWKGPVSRFTLWRVGNLARAQISPSERTLRVMLELREQQQTRK